MNAQRHTSTAQFRARATIAIKDGRLQGALDGATGHFRSGHDSALADLPHARELTHHLKAIRSSTLARLGEHLETFEKNARTADMFAGDEYKAAGKQSSRTIKRKKHT